MNKADKCPYELQSHVLAAVSSAQQQISSTSQVHNLCKSTRVIVMHKADTMQADSASQSFSADFRRTKFGVGLRVYAQYPVKTGALDRVWRHDHGGSTVSFSRWAIID